MSNEQIKIMQINFKATALHKHVCMLYFTDILELTKYFTILDIKYPKF